MQEIKRFQVRGVPGEVVRVQFGSRIVDYWVPKGGTDRLLIAHDGQNVFDRKTSHCGQTWKMAQAAIHVSQELGISPPAIIAVWHSKSKENPWGRVQDLTPQRFFTKDAHVDPRWKVNDSSFVVKSDDYLDQIFNTIVPAIFPESTPDKTAVIGASMGGLATLYAAITHPDKFTTALALSTHWIISDQEFARKMIEALPLSHKVWMSRGNKGLDAEYPPLQDFVDQLMVARGFGNRYMTKAYNRSGHNERSWAKYLHEPLRFWLSS
jgi:predicted alpha/beta superfamily hydrolase